MGQFQSQAGERTAQEEHKGQAPNDIPLVRTTESQPMAGKNDIRIHPTAFLTQQTGNKLRTLQVHSATFIDWAIVKEIIWIPIPVEDGSTTYPL